MSNSVVTVLVTVALGLLLVLVLWPGPARAIRLLERWGVAEPDDVETDEALRYLRRRRLLYPGLYLAISLAAPLLPPDRAGLWPWVLAILLIGGLLAESIAQPPSRRPAGKATSVYRGVRNLIPAWSLGTAAAVLAGLIVLVVAALAGAEWGLRAIPSPSWAMILGLGSVAVGIAAVWLVARQPVEELRRAEQALRLRSARVAIGLTMAALGSIAASGGSPAGLALGVLGLVGWLATTARVRPAGTGVRALE